MGGRPLGDSPSRRPARAPRPARRGWRTPTTERAAAPSAPGSPPPRVRADLEPARCGSPSSTRGSGGRGDHLQPGLSQRLRRAPAASPSPRPSTVSPMSWTRALRRQPRRHPRRRRAAPQGSRARSRVSFAARRLADERGRDPGAGRLSTPAATAPTTTFRCAGPVPPGRRRSRRAARVRAGRRARGRAPAGDEQPRARARRTTTCWGRRCGTSGAGTAAAGSLGLFGGQPAGRSLRARARLLARQPPSRAAVRRQPMPGRRRHRLPATASTGAAPSG